jgi:hypothetical protein
MKKLLALVLLTITLCLSACSSKENIEPEQINILSQTVWLRKDMSSEIIYGGGDNYLKLSFKQDYSYEIVRIKGDKINSIYEEGVYTITDNKDVILNTQKNNQKTSLRYVLDNSRTLNRVTDDGQILTHAYEAYIKQ